MSPRRGFFQDAPIQQRAPLYKFLGVVTTFACGLVALGAAVSTPRAAATTSSATVWLCRPGLANDPCAAGLSTTIESASGERTLQTAQPALNPPFDCFYAYPTVSTQKRMNANLRIQPGEIGAAVAQASRFSQACQVWAPMYRQRTELSLAEGLGNDPTADQVAYDSLLAAFQDYLTHDNNGRPIIFIGHSQGAAMLIRLLHNEVDNNPALRSKVVSAIILGGNVQVPKGRLVGGTFKHIPACSSSKETGCVIAYSSFPSVPPPNSNFGRPGTGVSLQSDQRTKAGETIVCTNPAALSGGAGPLSPYFLTSTSPTSGAPVETPWVSYPNHYTASCRTSNGATWLQVSSDNSAKDHRPTVTETLGPTWGYHLDDVNLALGNLVQDVRQQESVYSTTHG